MTIKVMHFSFLGLLFFSTCLYAKIQTKIEENELIGFSSYSDSLAQNAAFLCSVAYKSSATIDINLGGEYQNIGHIYVDNIDDYKLDLQGFVATKTYASGKRLIVVVVRGTEKMDDWMTDFDIAEDDFNGNGINVHRGFNKSFEGLKSQVNSKISFQASDYVLVTGHSLGGGIATLYAAYLKDAGILSTNNFALYTFGAPASGSEDFRAAYDDAFNNYRIRNKKDPVPYSTYFDYKVPPSGVFSKLGTVSVTASINLSNFFKGKRKYYHIGSQIVYDSIAGGYSSDENVWLVNIIDIKNTATAKHHSMLTYINNFGVKINFSDVYPYHWAYTYIFRMSTKGVVSGYANGEFGINDPVKIGEFSKIVSKSLFDDAPDSNSLLDYYSYMSTKGYFNGVSFTSAQVDNYISRSDVAVVLANVASNPNVKLLNFNDSSLATPDQLQSASYLKSIGVMNGYQNGNFGFGESLTRAEICKIVLNYNERAL